MQKYLFLKEMITPKILDVIYWIVTIIVILSSLITMFGGGFLVGLGMLIAFPILVRIQFELLYVLFGIYENTKKIADK